VHPIEHLRYVARYGDGDAVAIAEEAAVALGSLGYEPRALVPSCRRLLEAHPTCGPLWWVAARLLVAESIRSEVTKLLDALHGDATTEELAAAIPASADVAAEASSLVVEALSMRPDIEIRLVGAPRMLRAGLRGFGFDANASGWDLDEADDAVVDADYVVVDSLAAGPQGFLLSAAGACLARAAARASQPLVVTTGVGRVLPAALFARLLAMNGIGVELSGNDTSFGGVTRLMLADEDDDARTTSLSVEFLKSEIASRVIGPGGQQMPRRALARSTCVAPPELLFSTRAG
jgi:hypothetical protein